MSLESLEEFSNKKITFGRGRKRALNSQVLGLEKRIAFVGFTILRNLTKREKIRKPKSSDPRIRSTRSILSEGYWTTSWTG